MCRAHRECLERREARSEKNRKAIGQSSMTFNWTNPMFYRRFSQVATVWSFVFLCFSASDKTASAASSMLSSLAAASFAVQNTKT